MNYYMYTIPGAGIFLFSAQVPVIITLFLVNRKFNLKKIHHFLVTSIGSIFITGELLVILADKAAISSFTLPASFLLSCFLGTLSGLMWWYILEVRLDSD